MRGKHTHALFKLWWCFCEVDTVLSCSCVWLWESSVEAKLYSVRSLCVSHSPLQTMYTRGEKVVLIKSLKEKMEGTPKWPLNLQRNKTDWPLKQTPGQKSIDFSLLKTIWKEVMGRVSSSEPVSSTRTCIVCFHLFTIQYWLLPLKSRDFLETILLGRLWCLWKIWTNGLVEKELPGTGVSSCCQLFAMVQVFAQVSLRAWISHWKKYHWGEEEVKQYLNSLMTIITRLLVTNKK